MSGFGKKVLFTLFLFLSIVSLTACSSGPLTEKEMIRQMPIDLTTIIVTDPFTEGPYREYEMEVVSLNIESRQTTNKTDTVDCVVELSNEYYNLLHYYTLNFTYWDKEGWVLDDYSVRQGASWLVKENPFDADEVAEYLKDHNEYESVEPVDIQLLDGEIVEISNQVVEKKPLYTNKGIRIDSLSFEEGDWSLATDVSQMETTWNLDNNAMKAIEEYLYYSEEYSYDLRVLNLRQLSFFTNTELESFKKYIRNEFGYDGLEEIEEAEDWMEVIVLLKVTNAENQWTLFSFSVLLDQIDGRWEVLDVCEGADYMYLRFNE